MDNEEENSQKEREEEITTIEQTNHDNKEKLVQEVVKVSKEREMLLEKKNQNEYKLSEFLNASQSLQTLELPSDANQEVFEIILRKIVETINAIKEFRHDNETRQKVLRAEISDKSQELKEIKVSFAATKEKVALQSINCDNGERYNKEEVKYLLQKEDEAQQKLEYFQFESIKKRHSLNKAIEDKRNLVEGPFDYGEYEIMCTKTESNAEVIKQLKEEIRNLTNKSTSVVNALGHLNQKLHSMQIESGAAEAKEKPLQEELKELRSELFEEKKKLANINKKTEEMRQRLILLRHPRLVEDYQNLVMENDKHRGEIEMLKATYERLRHFTS